MVENAGYLTECTYPIWDGSQEITWNFILRRIEMAYICQNCGATSSERKELCNPIDDWGNKKLCEDWTRSVCEAKAPEVEYYCSCGNVSADPQFLCNPKNIWEK